jgi:hypothetical protein
MRTIIDRDEWKAAHDDGFHDRRLPAEEVWLHHSVTIAPDLLPPFDDDYAAVRTLERIGEERFGRGISYTWPITPVGLVFEGHSVGRSGSHTKNRNDIAAAICWVGNYDTTKPTEELILSTAWLLVHAKRQGWIRHARLNGGHQQAPGQDPTGCPGRHALAAIPRINQLAADYEAGRIDLQEDDMQLHELLDSSVFTPDGRWVYTKDAIGSAAYASLLLERQVIPPLQALAKTVAALAQNPAVTPEFLAAEIDRAVEEHTPTAEQVAAAQLPHIQAAVREVLGDDNDDQAEQIVRLLGEKLAGAGNKEALS